MNLNPSSVSNSTSASAMQSSSQSLSSTNAKEKETSAVAKAERGISRKSKSFYIPRPCRKVSAKDDDDLDDDWDDRASSYEEGSKDSLS